MRISDVSSDTLKEMLTELADITDASEALEIATRQVRRLRPGQRNAALILMLPILARHRTDWPT